MTVRAKFVCQSARHFTPDGTGQREYVFVPQYDMSIPEDRRFQKASPWGEFKIMVDNPAVFERFKVGQAYYLDLIEAPPSVV